jgi:hypothetical protein
VVVNAAVIIPDGTMEEALTMAGEVRVQLMDAAGKIQETQK